MQDEAATRSLKVLRTVYVKNVNDKVKLDEARRNLGLLFSRYGRVVDVHMEKRERMRGQAFVTMGSSEEAQQALKYLQSFPFFSKKLCLEEAKSESLASMVDKGFYSRVRRSKRSLHLLRVENFDESVKTAFLDFFFRSEEGFASVRHVFGSGECIVEFEDEKSREEALAKFDGFVLSNTRLLRASRVAVKE